MSARGRTIRDWRRRRLGQNFLEAATAERLIAQAEFRPSELVVEIGAGLGAMTVALARRDLRIVAVEPDPQWSGRLRERLGANARIRVVDADFLSLALPTEPFRVVGSLPFGATTDMLRRLLDDPHTCLQRADIIVQWEVARKRAARPPSTLLSTIWAPWWEMHLGDRIPASKFRPIPRVDAALLTITRRDPPLLPTTMARPYAQFVRQHWPLGLAGGTSNRRR
jgi:23S rRNA (adenine-N6)-dimethyltransferase